MSDDRPPAHDAAELVPNLQCMGPVPGGIIPQGVLPPPMPSMHGPWSALWEPPPDELLSPQPAPPSTPPTPDRSPPTTQELDALHLVAVQLLCASESLIIQAKATSDLVTLTGNWYGWMQQYDVAPRAVTDWWLLCGRSRRNPTALEQVLKLAHDVAEAIWPTDGSPRLILRSSGLSRKDIKYLQDDGPAILARLEALCTPPASDLETGLSDELLVARTLARLPDGAAAATLLNPPLPDRGSSSRKVGDDGPLPPDRFCFADATATGLSVLQYRLLELLWDAEKGCPKDGVPREAAAETLYAGEKERPSDPSRAIKSLRQRTQERLDKHGVPVIIEMVNGLLLLTTTSRR